MATTDTVRELFLALDRKHPDWENWSDEWELYRDVVGDVLVDESKYLPQNTLEDRTQYEFRKRLAYWIPETPLAIGKLVSALYRDKPKREFNSSKLDKFAENVDRDGTDIDDFMERVARNILAYGTTRILINSPNLGEPRTRAEEIEQDIRPFLILYTPLNTPNWDVDSSSRLSMVEIKEETYRKENPEDEREKHAKITRFIMYTPSTIKWWEFKEDDKGQQVLISTSEVENRIKMIPMVIEYWPQKIRSMIGSSFSRYMARADVQLFQAETDLLYDAYIHAHPTLRVWTNKALKEVGVGTQAFLKLKPGDQGAEKENADYIPLPESSYNVLKGVIENRLKTIYRQGGTDPLGVLQPGMSILQTSGVSRAWSFGTSEGRILANLADCMADIERQIFEIVAQYYSSTFTGSIQYPEEFDMSSTQALIEETERVSDMPINSPLFIRKLHKRIAASKLGDASAKELQEIYDEIDENELLSLPQKTSPVSPKAFDFDVETEAEPVSESRQSRLRE